MGLGNMMQTGVSGLTAQATLLSTIGDNIANSDTYGYKQADAQFSSMVEGQSGLGSYNSGGVVTDVRNLVTAQGDPTQTSSPTDLAISGNGFFVVSDANGTPFLTRAGSFVQNSSGTLVNAAGFQLMGYSLANGTPSIVANSLTGLVPVTINETGLEANASNAGTFTANLPAAATAVAAANLPSTNTAGATYTEKTSLVGYDNLGNSVKMDVYMTNTGTNTWEVTAYNSADAAAGGGFPYSTAALATTTLSFNPANGDLAAASASSLAIPVPNGQTLQLNLSGMTQLGAGYTVTAAQINGNAPDAFDHVEIDNTGTVYSVLQDGTKIATYQIPLATVPSPDLMTETSGNVYSPSIASGDVHIGFASTGGFGSINPDSLEQSTVDIATELTNMIDAQRNYTANSKVIQTAATLMDILENLK